MSNTLKKTLSIVLALVMLTATVAAALSVSAVADEAPEVKLVQTFTADNYLGMALYDDGSPGETTGLELSKSTDNITFNDDGSFTMDSKDIGNHGMRVLFSVDDAMKTCFAEAQQVADEKYEKKVEEAKAKAEAEGKTFDESTVAKVNPALMAYFRIEKSLQAKAKADYMRDTFLYYGYVKNDGTFLPVVKTGGNMYQEKATSFPLQYHTYRADKLDELSEGDAIALENFDDIKAIYIEAYHWNAYDKAVTFSGLAVRGTPTISEFEAPDTGDAKTDVVVNWDPEYKQSYSGSPDRLTFSADDGVEDEYKTSKKTGWMKYEVRTSGAQNQWMTYFFFDRDQFNKGVTVANKEGNSHKMKITFTLESCVDQENNPVKAMVDLTAAFYNGGYKTIINAWQEPGTSVTYEFDATDFTLNSVAGFRVAVQNFWYYDKDNNVVEYPEKTADSPDTDASGNTINYGTGVKRIYIKPTARISPIEVALENEVHTNATVTSATTTEAPTDNPGAGYHFFDFTPDTQAKEFGNSPDQIIYKDYTEKEGVDKLYDSDYGRVIIKSDKKVQQQHQMGWLTRSSSDNLTIIPEAVQKRVYNQMKQALSYANGPGGLHLLACDATVIAAKHGTTKEDCTIQCQIMIHAGGSVSSPVTEKWISIGKTSTLLLDVSELVLDDVAIVRLSPMNYANTDPDKGYACGVTNLEVEYSAVYVAGNSFATTARPTEEVNMAEAEAIYKLYKQLPATFTTREDILLLEQFINAYAEASIETQEYLAAKYALTMDDYGALLELFYELDLGGDIDDYDEVDTGATTPIAMFMAVAAAGFVLVKSRKK